MSLAPVAFGFKPSYRLAPTWSVVGTKWPVSRALRTHQGSMASTSPSIIQPAMANEGIGIGD